MNHEIPEPFGPLTDDERALVAQLSDIQRNAIDEALLSEVTARWRKVAMVVGCAMGSSSHVPGIPDRYYGLRVRALLEQGRIEARGNVDYMRFSEVRRPLSEIEE